MVDINKLVEDVKTHVVPGPMRDALVFLLQRERHDEEDQELVFFRERLPGWIIKRSYYHKPPIVKKVLRRSNLFFAKCFSHDKKGDITFYILCDGSAGIRSELDPVLYHSPQLYWVIHQATMLLLHRRTYNFTGITEEVGDLKAVAQELQKD